LTLVEPVREWKGIGMGTDGKFRVDGSALETAYRCSTKAALKYLWGLTDKGEKASLLAGKAFHAALSAYIEGKHDPIAVFDANYKEWAQLNVAYEDKRSWANTRAVVEHYFTSHLKAVPWPFQPVLTEQAFEIPLMTTADGVEILFVGRMDVLGAYSGGYVVVEGKSGWLGQQWIDKWALNAQLSGYVWAARQLWPDQQIMGAFVIGIEWRTPRKEPNRKCKTHSVPQRECESQHNKYELVGLIERHEAMLENWLGDARAMAEGLYRLSCAVGDDMEQLGQLSMEGTWTGECEAFGAGGCPYRKSVCEIGRRAGVARATLEFNPWNPLEGA
jgi:hypothetical protein